MLRRNNAATPSYHRQSRRYVRQRTLSPMRRNKTCVRHQQKKTHVANQYG
jgi:hypothetical protein